MKLLTIKIVSDCNQSCNYCPVELWRFPLDYIYPSGQKANAITNEALLKWLDKFISPDEWLLELSGGEPGMYPEIQTLVPELAERGYYGLIKTNGTLPIPESKTIQRIACWHIGRDFPEYYDQILIMRAMHDDWRAKVEYCRNENIPYGTIAFDYLHEGQQKEPDVFRSQTKITETLFMSSMGQIVPCSNRWPPGFNTIFDMKPPITFKTFLQECPKCKNICDCDQFWPQIIKEKIEVDYIEYRGKEGQPLILREK